MDNLCNGRSGVMRMREMRFCRSGTDLKVREACGCREWWLIRWSRRNGGVGGDDAVMTNCGGDDDQMLG